jgi:hypothetical protein
MLVELDRMVLRVWIGAIADKSDTLVNLDDLLEQGARTADIEVEYLRLGSRL